MIAYTDNSTMLNCTSRGRPSQNQLWYRNGVPLIKGVNRVVFQNNSVLLKKLNWEDNGIFQCGVSNFAALKFAQVQVKVQSKYVFYDFSHKVLRYLL